ncbi:MAG TPA: hypothetical protein VFY79_09895 [Dehalococcoidia bacterium]|jgi:hypothetical protein|nr:hypothetical protein [Dehalococcoidia bacterium]
MQRISKDDWAKLEDLAWEWDPIGVPRNQFTTGEYDCIVEAVVPLLQRGCSVDEIVKHFDSFFPEHFGLPNQPGCVEFAQAAIGWWREWR